MDQAL